MPEDPTLRESPQKCDVGDGVLSSLLPEWTLAYPSHSFLVQFQPTEEGKIVTSTSLPHSWTFQLHCLNSGPREPREFCWIRID
jgi:hypothetical protein